MNGLLLAVLLLQVNPAPTGVATGVVLGSNGMPAANVRVFAIQAGDANVVSANSAVFDSLAQTDATGRYRLEIPAGRYYIAAGSVSSPTFFPDTPYIESARAILITAGTTVESVNFSRYVLPTPAIGGLLAALPPGSTGALSGTIRSFDGTPAPGITVVAYPKTRSGRAESRVVTDANGRYRFENVTPDTYNIVAGYSDSPVFYPGTGDIKMATAIVTTPATVVDNLNFTLSAIPKTTIRGHVTALADRPAGAAGLFLTRVDPLPVEAAASLPTRIYKEAASGGDGTYEITDVVPGSYALRARMDRTSAITKNLVVGQAAEPIEIDFSFPIHVVYGRILWEDGTPVSEPLFKEVAVATVSNPNFVATTVLPVSRDGVFSGVVEADDYRFLFLDLPQDYTVQSVTSAKTDLLKEKLQVSIDAPVDIEVRIAKKQNAAPKLSGRVVDAVTSAPTAAERVTLCCFDSGPFHRQSARLRADGSFDFSEVPAGSYSVTLQAMNPVRLVEPTIDVGTQSISGLTLVTSSQFALAMATIVSDGGGSVPPDLMASVTLKSQKEPFRITTTARMDGQFWFNAPAGIRYSISVTELPAGYKVKSISNGSSDPPITAETAEVLLNNASSSPIRITISVRVLGTDP